MPVPVRFRSNFSLSTIRTIESNASRFAVKSPVFFRSAYTANVVEAERRTFQPVVVLDASRVVTGRCSCQAAMRLDDLCRHIAVLLESLASHDGALPSEQFEASVWRSVAFAAFSEGESIEQPDGDHREQTLRRYVLTDQEQKLLTRGSGSQRLLFEASPWYRWGKRMFLGAEAAEAARLEIRDGEAVLSAGSARVVVPPAAVEQMVNLAPGIITASGFEISQNALTPALRIELTPGRALRFTPVLLGSGGSIFDRASLPRYGKYFLSADRFVPAAAAPPVFVDRQAGAQSTLFELRPSAGIPLDRETLIAENQVFAFIERHREELARMPATLAPECVRNARPVRLDGEVTFDFSPAHRDLLEVVITFRATEEETITAAEIARARKDGVRALIRGNVWIELQDPQFAWLDETTIGPRGHLLVTRLELLRIRGSLRGQAKFSGDPSCERIFRMFDELPADSDAPTASALGMNLYAYQQTGYHWLWLLQRNGFGGLLCDDMGLGKTHQAMALIRAIREVDREHAILVVCPTSLIDHWREKLSLYLPEVPIEVIHATARPSEKRVAEGTAPVVITTYGIVRSKFEQFRGRRFDLVVLDEMQTVKNADTATHHALRGIEKRIAIGLTGTPIENHEGELKTLLDFVVPGYLPKEVADRAALQRLVRPFVLRRTKSQVLTQLPPKIVDRRFCEMTSEQRTLYRRVIESRARPLRSQLHTGGTVSYVHIFAALNYLKQICNHPASVGGGFGDDVTSGKWESFVELIDECMTSGLKVVVFSQYLSMLSIIEDHLFRNGIGYASIKGSTRERGSEVARFRDDPDCRVFTASLRAGGLGIDLTSASVVIHYDRWWNQAREDQATDRVHRLGQSKGVQVIKLITRNSIEEKIDALIARKGALADEVVRTDDPSLVKQFSRDELEELLADD